MTFPVPRRSTSPWPEIEPLHRTSYGSSGRQEFTAACPSCGRDAEWTARFSTPPTVRCDCEETT